MMTLEEMRKYEWSISWSGGKDSTATVILAHELKIPIKEIIYVRMMFDENTPATLPIMTEFIDRTADVFRDWCYKVTILPSVKTAMDLASKKYVKSIRDGYNGMPYGIRAFCRNHCKFQREKANTVNQVKPERSLIGIGANEKKRYERLKSNEESLLYVLNKTEQDCFEICISHKMLSPLYMLGIKRDGCWFCPNAKKKERDHLRIYHNDLVKKIYAMVEMTECDIRWLSNTNNWIADYYLEQEQNGGLFDEVM